MVYGMHESQSGRSAASVLIVDDDEDILRILKDNLELDGYQTFCASSGRQALELFHARDIHLVVLDLMLPDIDGIQVCRAVRSRSQVPIIMLTAKDAVTDKVLGLESGADDYIVKPFDYLELAARIRARLRRSGLPAVVSSVLKIGALHLDSSSRQVRLNGRNVPLTKKEFDLLYLMARHAGQVLGRETIRRDLWPDKTLYHWSRTIDVHIQHLRAKLKSGPATCGCIVTVQGVGYMLKPERLTSIPLSDGL